MNGRRGLIVAALAVAASSGCTTISDGLNAINPFGSSGPKMSPLPAFKPTVEARVRSSISIGKAGNYVFVPSVQGTSIFVAAADGTIARYDDGAPAWRIQAGQPLSAGVGSDGKIVAVGTPKGDVLVFSASDGKPVWQGKVSSEILAAPAIGDDGLAVRSGDNQVFLFDKSDGRRKWVYQRATPSLSLRNWAAPVFADRYIFVGFPGGKLVALALQNGAPVWEGTVSLPKGATELERVADIVAQPVIDGRQICAVAFQGRVACFDLGQSGSLNWARDISSASGIAIDSRNLYVTDDKGAVLALDRNSGASVWKQDKLLNRRVTGSVVSRGYVAVGDGEGYVHLLNRDDGSFAARVATDGKPILATPTVAGTAILVQTTGGMVAAIEAQ